MAPSHPNRSGAGPSRNPTPEEIRAARDALGLSQRAAAELIHGTERAWQDWEQGLRQWADQALARGQSSLLDSAVPAFERIMIETALKHTAGRRRDAAVLLGWGRNTLTRKIKELGMKIDGDEDDSDEA